MALQMEMEKPLLPIISLRPHAGVCGNRQLKRIIDGCTKHGMRALMTMYSGTHVSKLVSLHAKQH